ncbi:shikimate dehydrogenase [Nocardioides dongxiaopingii]|uniref:shikimate dehydrogenase n=1 Tax=Nocardioides dongxiaopingii TaxID=2576036 RepID=UPI0010C764F0|nr:shikimate dehydrogenase [Nocardioides dongxiaopingii]
MRCAVLGDPIAHSLSPVLHRAAYDALGLDGWTYDAVRVPSGGLAGFLAAIPGSGDGDGREGTWRGLSLTMPLKREVLDLVAARSARVDLAHAANTVILGGEGGATLDNTDLPGAAAAIRERYDGPVGSAVVLGAGATASSVGLALCDLGAREVRLLARSPERAADTVEAIRAHASRPEVSVGGLDEAAAGADVLVSTVPAAAQAPDLVGRWLGEAPVVFEVLYDPWPTPLADAAHAAGRVLVSGLDLLVHQAALQVEAFTGWPGPLPVMRLAGAAALAARTSAG